MNRALLTSLLCAASVSLGQEAVLPSPPPLAEVPQAVAEPATKATPPLLTARERRNGSVGVGYLGLASMAPTFTGGGLGGLAALRIQVPMLGIRWWFRDSRVGLDVGLGAMGATAPDFFSPSLMVVGHIGVPIALLSTQHVIVLLAPEFRAGFSTLTGGASAGGSLLELALRGGVELFFGFIGVPDLSVEAAVRVGVARDEQSFFSPFGGSSGTANFRFSTSLSGDAASVIASTLSLKYYF